MTAPCDFENMSHRPSTICGARTCLSLRFIGLSLPVLASSSLLFIYLKSDVTDGQSRRNPCPLLFLLSGFAHPTSAILLLSLKPPEDAAEGLSEGTAS